AMLEYALACQVQTDPRAGLLLAEGRLARGERLVERLVGDAAVEALTTIGHRHDDAFVERAGEELDRLSGGGVPAGVVEELADDAADTSTVRDGVERVRHLRSYRDAGVRPGHLVDRMADEGTQINVGNLEGERTPFQLGDRDDLVDDLDQAIQRRLQLLDELLPLLGRDVRVPQDVGDPLCNRHRGPQLV